MMAFNVLKSALESKLTHEACWQQPSALRMEITQLFDEIATKPLNSATQFVEIRDAISHLLEQDNLTDVEQTQRTSLLQLLEANRFPEKAKSAILNDLKTLIAEPVPA